MPKQQKHKQNKSKDPELVAKRKQRKKKVQARQIVQAPLIVQMQNTDCPIQETRNLIRRVPELMAQNPDFKVVRFCLPNYPEEWIQHEEDVEPFATFLNNSFRGQANVQCPLDIHLAGGYVLVLVADEASAGYARSLLPGLIDYLGTGVREPSLEEIDRFHAAWFKRSPGMFNKFGPKFAGRN